ncbi:MAG: dockerin type I domain-containing protein [Clostridia bacterium]
MKKFLAAVLFLCVTLTSMLAFYSAPMGSLAENSGYVQNYVTGDVTGDGLVDGRDTGLLLQHLAEWEVSVQKAAADLNGDHLIDGKDSGMLLQYLADWEISFPERNTVPVIDTPDYHNQVTKYSTSYGGVDGLKRTLLLETSGTGSKKDKCVGLFYFLWMGAHGTALYDNTKIVNTYADALRNQGRWGNIGTFHFWGEPLFGYYVSSDQWVMRKHIQMLTDADVDFLVFDTTNASGGKTTQPVTNNGGGNNTYVANALAMLKLLDEYSKAGWDVPQVAFYTNSNSGSTMDVLYDEVYRSHPEYSHLWFQWEGKPMIIGTSSQASDTVRNFFRIKESQWPNEGKKEDGIPWMEFHRSLTQNAVYTYHGKKIINVSVAQHNVTCRMSASWYGSSDRTRSYSDGVIKKYEAAVQYGFNFAEQWNFALKNDPDMIFITGWNEWIAQRQPAAGQESIVFIDNASMEASRDTEPMRGGYGDNYYMQMVNYIRKFKGTEDKISTDNAATIRIGGGFGQWDYIRAFYKDFENDTVDRNQKSYGGITYKNTSGRNDITEAKVCNDENNVYFFVKTAQDLTKPSGSNWMNLYIATGNRSNPNWCGYDFILNRITPSGKAVLERCNASDAFSWSKAAEVEYAVSGDMMMVAIPKAALGITGSDFTIQFKWSDNCTSADVYSFYTDGDAAPYGRMNYVYAAGKG